jgi:hypothetical protein
MRGFVVPSEYARQGSVRNGEYAHMDGSRQIWRAGENWPDDLYMFVQAGEMDPGAGDSEGWTFAALVTIMLLSCLP